VEAILIPDERSFMAIWKFVAKFWYSQFLLWVKAYNEVADRYMIAESWSGSSCFSVVRLTIRATDPPLAVGESEAIDTLPPS
jgi:hypothetical protein